MNLRLKRTHPAAALPVYASEGAAAFDLRAVERGVVPANGAHTFRTGLSFEIPEGHAILIFSRSGHGFKNDLRLANCVGVIDSDYRGEVMVKITNDSLIGFEFEASDRIAQGVVVQVPRVSFVEVDELTETARGAGGFGSTGKN